jgi:heme A synthase
MVAQFPGKAVSNDADANDLVKPLQSILQGVNLLGFVSPSPTADPKSPGVAVLEANATALSKWAAKFAGGSATLALVGTGIAAFWKNNNLDVRLAAVAGLSVVLVAALIGIAWIVAADLKSRSKGQIVIYQARQAIALQFLQESLAVSQTDPEAGATSTSDSTKMESAVIALAASGEQALVTYTPDGRQGHLAGLRTNGNVIEVGWLVSGSETRDWAPASSFVIDSYTYP